MEQISRARVGEFLRRLEEFDFSGALKLCTDSAVVWQNDGEGEQAMDKRLDHFKSFVTTVASLRYDVNHQVGEANEVFQQHVLRLEMTDGSSAEVHAAVYFHLDGELIHRIEEYVYTVPATSAA
ncbi:nuclear transport factor 2 family protein [Streptomyces paludis]|uniref:Nuclear transport factor 2 family protein n=1 Tax=Streptomyces paludis TaxID=2282738 RepID=A0A345HZ21_9ACTN|nr:nuclear transport factor 2 family protein [Streptomyces paludis]AXG81945.1 nuclear transport factor 2 family protein [Streptomyces paludis]